MNLREQMPQTAAFIDELRAVFGAEVIDPQIKRGMRGEPTFFATENGHTVGTPTVGWESVPLFGPDRPERTEEGQRELHIKRLKERAHGAADRNRKARTGR